MILEMKAKLKNIKISEASHFAARSAAFNSGVKLQDWMESAVIEKLKKQNRKSK
jgi:glucose/arabinose dehydrogenase